MAATDEALLLSLRQNQRQPLPTEFNRCGDDNKRISSENSEELASSPRGGSPDIGWGSDVKEACIGLRVGGAAGESPTALKRAKFHSRSRGREEQDKDKGHDNPKWVALEEDSRCPTEELSSPGGSASKRLDGRGATRRTNSPPKPAGHEDEENDNVVPKDGCVEQTENVLEQRPEAGVGAGFLGVSGGDHGGSGSSGGTNVSDASWSSSDDDQASAGVCQGIVKRRGPAFHGADDWIGTSPYGSDDECISRVGSSAANKAKTGGESTEGSGSGWEPTTTKKARRKEQRQVHCTSRTATGRAVSAPSPAASLDDTPFRGRIREGQTRGPKHQTSSKLSQTACKPNSGVEEGSCGLSLKLRAAVEAMPSSAGPKQQSANNTSRQGNVNTKGAKGLGLSPTSKKAITPSGSRSEHARQSAHGSSVRQRKGSVTGREEGVGQQKGEPAVGQPGGGGSDTATRETWMHQPLLLGGGQRARKRGSGSGGSGGGREERREHGDQDVAVAGGGGCEAWVVREFKARVEAARRQEEAL